MVSLTGSIETMLVARSDGLLAADVRPLVRFNVQVIVEHHGRRETGYAGGGGRYDYVQLLADGKPENWAREALRQALVNLQAGQIGRASCRESVCQYVYIPGVAVHIKTKNKERI